MFYLLTVIIDSWTSVVFVLDEDGNIYIVWIFTHLLDIDIKNIYSVFWVVNKHISWSTFFLVWRSRLPGSRCVWLEILQHHIFVSVVMMGTSTFWKCWQSPPPVAANNFTRTGFHIANPQVSPTCSYSWFYQNWLHYCQFQWFPSVATYSFTRTDHPLQVV